MDETFPPSPSSASEAVTDHHRSWSPETLPPSPSSASEAVIDPNPSWSPDPSSPAQDDGVMSHGNGILPVNDIFQPPNGDDESTDAEAGNGHSLPAPDEIKVDRPTSTGGEIRPMMVLLGLLLFSALIVGLGVGLSADNRRANPNRNDAPITSNSNPPPSSKDRRQAMMDYIVGEGVSATSDFEFAGTPQSRALDFMAFIDSQQYPVPSGGMSTDSGYKFMSRYVMSVLYYSLGGPTWNYNLLFLSEHDTCDWFFVFQPPVGQVGVLCNQSTMQIVGVSFIFNKLDGELPKEMGHLTTLTYIESIGNNIKGSIPDTFRQLTDLRTVVFPYNLLTGSIPTWMGQMSKLEFFYMSDNALTGSLPTFDAKDKMSVFAVDDNSLDGSVNFAWEFSNLEHLFLEANGFSGTFPPFITATNPKLKTLDVSGNKLSGSISPDILRLAKLEILDVHNNTLNGKVPSDVILSSNLNFVAMHSNALTGLIPGSLANLQGLLHLDLSNNQLTGEIPNELVGLSKLIYLFLSNNMFTPGPIPVFMFEFSNLNELSLQATSRAGPISSLVATMSKLILLDLQDNFLTGSIPTTLAFLPNLQILLLNNNQLTGNVPTELGRLSALQVCLLDANNLKGTMAQICQAKTLGMATADCEEVTCECCKPCCVDGVDCHKIDLDLSADPRWETGYQRRFFNFGNSSKGFELIPTGGQQP